MAEVAKKPKQESQNCFFCKTGPLDKLVYITHILGKRHQKNLKNRNQPPASDVARRTVHVSGYDANTQIETILGAFWKHRVRNVNYQQGFTFIEFDTVDIAQEVLKQKFSIGNKPLKVSAKRQNNSRNDGAEALVLSQFLENMLKQRVPANQIDNQIYSIIREVELRPEDYQCREYLRKSMMDFLAPHFPKVFAYVFGSSANNLGFVGCDVDLYMDLGVDPWAQGSKSEMDCKASDLTWYLAREIRRSRRGINVRAVARARVPIVKFIDSVTRLQVDLSFKHGMPVYNTALICQYTRTHYLVRPYLMIIRYWAKIQGITGGGQPATLITNYAFTMLMLFVLMSRSDPIVPSVAHLKRLYQGDMAGQCIVGGWDCGFGRNVVEWNERRHNTSIFELIAEFFEYYGKFDAKKWMVCPLAGFLIERSSVKERNLRKLPSCLEIYCRQDVNIQVDTPICVQDPFEHSHNITRGLRDAPLAEFQLKCRRAADICRDIHKGKESLGKLLEPIEISSEDLTEITITDDESPEEIDQSQEVITLDDSDADTSQDSIEILDIPKKNGGGEISVSPVPGTSTAIGTEAKKVVDISDIMIIHEGSSDEKKNDATANGVQEKEMELNGVISQTSEELELVMNQAETGPEQKLYKYPLDFTNCTEFTVTADGEVCGGKGSMTGANDIGQAASSLIHFVLKQCLKIDVSIVEVASSSKKRKSESPEDDSESGKRRKVRDGVGVSVAMKYRRVAQLDCTSESKLWIGRKMMSKKIPQEVNSNPLKHEMAITAAQMQVSDSKPAPKAELLVFTLGVWQECENPCKILVTGDSRSDERITRSQMANMYAYLSSLSQQLLRRVQHYVNLQTEIVPSVSELKEELPT